MRSPPGAVTARRWPTSVGPRVSCTPDWVEHAFKAWLDRLRGKARTRRRAALIALCDVHTWWLLSHDLGFARPEVRATLTQAIRSLLEEDM